MYIIIYNPIFLLKIPVGIQRISPKIIDNWANALRKAYLPCLKTI